MLKSLVCAKKAKHVAHMIADCLRCVFYYVNCEIYLDVILGCVRTLVHFICLFFAD